MKPKHAFRVAAVKHIFPIVLALVPFAAVLGACVAVP
jgi:predicted branched-subunit amino acid permease